MLLSCTAVYSTPAAEIDSYNFDEFFAEFTVYRNSDLSLVDYTEIPNSFPPVKRCLMLVDLICSKLLLSSKL